MATTKSPSRGTRKSRSTSKASTKPLMGLLQSNEDSNLVVGTETYTVRETFESVGLKSAAIVESSKNGNPYVIGKDAKGETRTLAMGKSVHHVEDLTELLTDPDIIVREFWNKEEYDAPAMIAHYPGQLEEMEELEAIYKGLTA